MNKFELVKKEIWSIIPKSPIVSDLEHSKLILKWILILCPDASEELQIAAIGHDMERAITGITEKDLSDYSKINEFKKEHAIRSAKFVSEVLEKCDYPKEKMDKIKHLIENHECGGDPESDILKNSDSLAYFEYNIPVYLEMNGKQRAIEKCKFMYERLSDDAKELVKNIKYKDKKITDIVKRAIE
jgi:hypothetical protein